ncbi:MAG: putative alpha/beta-fold hydrolase [Flavobacteriaceae bacterium]|jgi:predicted alpha/beta-fold hydrolase
MPLVKSQHQPKFLFKNGHFSTIYSAKLRPIPTLLQERERVALADGDFIDVDWSFSEIKTRKVAILLHGLEGNAQRVYIIGQAKQLVINGWDVAAMNHRGCSGEDNLLYESYNSGRTYDLESLIEFILQKGQYDEISLIGFSLGGNLVLKYLGEREIIPKEIIKGIAISAPLNLKGSLEVLNKPENILYNRVFVNDLRKKYKRKMSHFPDKMNLDTYKKIKTLIDFDNLYTAPAHGFNDAFDYYEKSSSIQFIENIKIPVLILSAKNDSFLSKECYPISLASQLKNVYLEIPNYGGHVGFHKTNKEQYSELRAVDFLTTK